MQKSGGSPLEITCPCCGARLKVDAELGKVLYHDPPPRQTKTADLEHASQTLDKEAARREALFKQSIEEEKIKTDLLDRKFKEVLRKSKDQPVTPPLKDIDLD
jgi:hypothetical protein